MLEFLTSASFSEVFAPAQIPAWIAFVIYAASYQVLNPRRTIFLWIPAGVLYAIHFFLLGIYSAMMIALGSLFRDTMAVWGSKRLFYPVLIIHFIFIWVMTFILADELYEYLCALGTSFLSMATFFRDRFVYHRLFSFGHQMSWLLFFFFIGSYAGVTQMCVMMLSNFIGLVWYKLMNEK